MNQQQNIPSEGQSLRQVPLWQLCTKSLDHSTSMKQIEQFLYSLRPQRIESIEKGAIFQRILNLLIVIEFITLDQLIYDQAHWGIRQYLFLVFLLFKFLWYGQNRSKRCYLSQKQVNASEKHQPMKAQSFFKGMMSKKSQEFGQKIESIIEWATICIIYLSYGQIQDYLYIPHGTKMILFTIMILLTNDSQKSSIKLSQLIVLSHKFHSYWIGLLDLIVNNKYDLMFEKEQISITDEQHKIQSVQIVFGISIFLMFIQFDQFNLVWSVYTIFLWIVVNLIQKIDRQCLTLKKKYKDEGVMVQIAQYH